MIKYFATSEVNKQVLMLSALRLIAVQVSTRCIWGTAVAIESRRMRLSGSAKPSIVAIDERRRLHLFGEQYHAK